MEISLIEKDGKRSCLFCLLLIAALVSKHKLTTDQSSYCVEPWQPYTVSSNSANSMALTEFEFGLRSTPRLMKAP